MRKSLFIISLVMMCLLQGFRVVVIVFVTIFLAGLAVITPIWLIAFVIGTVLTKDLKTTWQELNPVKIIKECFFGTLDSM